MCPVFVSLETGYTLLLLPTAILQNTACSKSKVTCLPGSLDSSEVLRWSAWDPMHLNRASSWHCEWSPPAWAGHLWGAQILGAVLLCIPHTMPQTGLQPVKEGRASSSLMRTAEVQGPAPPCAGPGASHTEHVFTVKTESDLYR